VQPMQPLAHNFIKVYLLVLNYKTYQGKVKHIIITNMKNHIINLERKLMKMGGREEILLERETTSLIISKILPEMIATSFINLSLKRDTMYRWRLVVIFT
jgi:hypothetical protein